MKDNELYSFIDLSHDKRVGNNGLAVVAVWCYRCYRCGHIWLPKDYDVSELNTLAREPPKSCARCKSKYWNKFRRDFENSSLVGKTREDAKDREFRRNQTPEERVKSDKNFKSFQRRIRRLEKKNQVN